MEYFNINGQYIHWMFFFWVKNKVGSEKMAKELFFKCRKGRCITDLVRWCINNDQVYNISNATQKTKDKWYRKHFKCIPYNLDTRTGHEALTEPTTLPYKKLGG